MEIFNIGRDESNRIVYRQNVVSNFHATLELHEDGKMVLKDHSSNATFVNDTRLHKSSRFVQRTDTIYFADPNARLDWALIPESKLNKGSIKWWHVALPLFILLIGITAWKLIPSSSPPPNSCNTEDIAAKFGNSVGLVVNYFYLKTRLVNGQTVFVGYDKKYFEDSGKRREAFNERSSELLPFPITGTGFLIQNEHSAGNVVTNKHVAYPSWAMMKNDEELLKKVRAKLYQHEDKKFDLAPIGGDRKFETSPAAIFFIPNGANFSIKDGDLSTQILEDLRVNKSAYSGDLCREHSDEDIDLALLNVNIPDKDKYYFIDYEKDIEFNRDSIKQGSPVILTGFAGGVFTGYDNSSKQVDIIIDRGTVSENSASRISYSGMTGAVEGSSGSPVFNSQCKIVAVHTSGRKNVEMYGILGHHIRDLLSKDCK